MQANKDHNYQIKESEADKYHVEFIRHELPRGSMKTVEKTMVQIFSPRDFEALKRCVEGDGKKNEGTGMFVTGWHEMKIIHDPLLYREDQNRKAEAEAKAEQAKAEAAKVKAEAKAAKEEAAKKKAEEKAKV
jgi:hypothetical protein